MAENDIPKSDGTKGTPTQSFTTNNTQGRTTSYNHAIRERSNESFPNSKSIPTPKTQPKKGK